MSDTIKIFCENSNSSLFVKMGSSLLDILEILAIQGDNPILAGYVNNRLKNLDFRIYSPVSIRYIDITHFEGIRVYQRTLFFTLQKAVHDLYPQDRLHIKHSVAKGFYCEIDNMENISQEQIDQISERMRALIAQNIPIVREKKITEEAEQLYTQLGFKDKISLLRTRPQLYVTVDNLADIAGYFYGSLAVSTGYIHLFKLTKYYKGFHIAIPQRTSSQTLEPMVTQEKMFEIFNEYTHWVDIVGVANIGALNSIILNQGGSELIKIAEGFHEKKLAAIADMIHSRHLNGQARVVFISGPSSSGKTTFAKRLGIQLRILGLKPQIISLDDYFVNRTETPLDENGDYDYEALEAIDVKLFNENLVDLLAGRTVEIPRYDFVTGGREYVNNTLTMSDDSVLIIEGIHGLNPELTPHISAESKFNIYVSALTSISMDNMNRISTTDSRLIRRMVRDYSTRGSNAVSTLRRWGSVRRGEDKHIFPNQEQADVMFNTSLFYEIAVLRNFVEPLLHEVPNTVPEFGEAVRLLKFLDQFTSMDPSEIPPTSILREFIGGSSFLY